jgi:uncharacterized cofD-like protein
VCQALRETNAKLLYVLNIMTKFGETHNFMGRDFVNTLETCLERRVDGVVVNTRRPNADLLAKYSTQKAEFVACDFTDPSWLGRDYYTADLLETSGGIVRHDARKLAALIMRIVSGEQEPDPCSAA